jgi:ADP-ribosyl-[dinitrogen reductase] hydrolase
VIAEYGHPITEYTKPNTKLAGSILNKSNLNGGGRSYGSSSNKSPKTIIGDIINHGKKDLWSPNKSIHYHATLQKGENTLEVQIGRVLMKSIVATGGTLDVDHFRSAYMDFMMKPNSHNDTYASTCHRMFFANLIFGKLPPDQCPDNDHHNVDTIDGLVLPTLASLVDPSTASACASATRKSKVLEDMSVVWGQVVQAAVLQSDDASFLETLSQFSRQTIRRNPNPTVSESQTMSACYISQALPGLIDLVAKYQPQQQSQKQQGASNSSSSRVWQGLLANANVGGENVHRGSVMGAILGARAGASNLPTELKEGLVPYDQLSKEIDDFVAVALPRLLVGQEQHQQQQQQGSREQ